MGGMRIDGTILQQELLPDDFMRHWMSNFTTILTYIKVSPQLCSAKISLVTAHPARQDSPSGCFMPQRTNNFTTLISSKAEPFAACHKPFNKGHRLSPCGLRCKSPCHSAGEGA